MPFSDALAVTTIALLLAAPAAAQTPSPMLAPPGAGVRSHDGTGAMMRASEIGNTGEANPDLLLGPVTTFPSAEAARTTCRGDRVVWTDGYDGYLYDSTEARYGATPTGAYACERDARRANYWDSKPQTDMAGHPGRVFPFTPVFVGS